MKFLLALCLISVLFVTLERFFGLRTPLNKPPKERQLDLMYWFVTPLITQTTTRLGILLGVILGVALGFEHLPTHLQMGQSWIVSQAYALQVFMALLVGDFTGYWIHRAFHGRRLWSFHAVHHSSRYLNWLSSVRVHPVNDFLAKAVQVIVLALCGFPLSVLGVFAPLLGLYGILLHTRLDWNFGPFRYLLVSPVYHRWHHTSAAAGLDKNFAGFFPVWDALFGTLYLPSEAPTEFGLDDYPETLWGQLKAPFVSETRAH